MGHTRLTHGHFMRKKMDTRAEENTVFTANKNIKQETNKNAKNIEGNH